MIGIEKIAYYLPPGRINNLKRIDKFDVPEEFVLEKLGMKKIAIKEKNQDTSDLCLKAVARLQEASQIELSNIDCVVVCTQNPDARGLPHTSAIIHNKLKLAQNCAAFDISLGCSGYVFSLSIIQSFMTANNLKHGLLFTCDPYSKIVDSNDRSTSMLFGDAATVTVFGLNPEWVLGKAVFGSIGEKWNAIHIDANRKLRMQGRDVFNFAARTVPDNIARTLEINNIKKGDIDLYILHQASKYIIDLLRKRLALPENKMPFCASEYGNTVSSSIPMILEGVSTRNRTVLLCGFGVGLSWGSIILKRKELGD